MNIENKCFNCGTKYVPYHSSDLFCSKKCRNKYYKYMKRVPTCKNCSNLKCEHKKTYEGKFSPKDCPDRKK